MRLDELRRAARIDPEDEAAKIRVEREEARLGGAETRTPLFFQALRSDAKPFDLTGAYHIIFSIVNENMSHSLLRKDWFAPIKDDEILGSACIDRNERDGIRINWPEMGMVEFWFWPWEMKYIKALPDGCVYQIGISVPRHSGILVVSQGQANKLFDRLEQDAKGSRKTS